MLEFFCEGEVQKCLNQPLNYLEHMSPMVSEHLWHSLGWHMCELWYKLHQLHRRDSRHFSLVHYLGDNFLQSNSNHLLHKNLHKDQLDCFLLYMHHNIYPWSYLVETADRVVTLLSLPRTRPIKWLFSYFLKDFSLLSSLKKFSILLIFSNNEANFYKNHFL